MGKGLDGVAIHLRKERKSVCPFLQENKPIRHIIRKILIERWYVGEYFDNGSINSRLTFSHVRARYFLLLLRVLALGLVEANGRELLGKDSTSFFKAPIAGNSLLSKPFSCQTFCLQLLY